jgi:alkylation response protein AidB-like acyl-CoA dehydrogenase
MVLMETITGGALVDAARALGGQIRAEADAVERERRLSAPLVQALKDAGIFRMSMPRSWGGPEADILTQIRVVEELSRNDGSVGWTAMIGSAGGFLSAFLDDDVGRELYRDLDAVTGGVTRPSGRAVAVDGGFRISGRWSFASGCQHSAWLVSGCRVFDGDAPRLDGAGKPAIVHCYLPADRCQILDTWTTTGLRGSGSHDYVVEDVFVPSEHTFDVFTSPIERDGPLYALRMIFVANIVGVPLGIARAAIEAAIALAETKTTVVGNGLRDEVNAQMMVARAEGLVGSARGFVFDVMGEIWDALRRGDPLTPRQRARFRLCLVTATEQCVEAVDLMYRIGGGSSLYATNPLDRHLRDIHTVQQHQVLSAKIIEAAGRVLLDLEPNVHGF